MSALDTTALDRLLTTLDISLHAFAVCNVADDARLVFGAMDMVVIHYVLRGHGVVEAPGCTPIPFAPGHMVIVPAGLEQSLAGQGPVMREIDASQHCAMLVDGLVKFDAGAGGVMTMCSTLSATYGGSFGMFDRIAQPIARDVSAMPAIAAAFDQLLAERAKPDVGTHALTEALMKQCLVLFLRAELSDGKLTSPFLLGLGDKRLTAAVSAVLRQPAAPRSVAELAQIAGMSRSAFAAAFSAAFQQSPMDFVQKTRLHHAAKLLTGTDLPVKVIAASMGFRNRSHFSRAFSTAYGEDPTGFRKRRRAVDLDAPGRSGRSWLERATRDSIGGTDTA